MALPIRTVLEDVQAVCAYLSKKPTGASLGEAKKVLDQKFLDGRKLSALKTWGLIEEGADGRLKITDEGRAAVRDEASKQNALMRVVGRVPPYRAVVERVAHRGETAISATDVAAHWHEHFSEDVADSDKTLNDQAVCFFQVASGAGLGSLVIGRRGAATRFEFVQEALRAFIEGGPLPAPPVTPLAARSDSPRKDTELPRSDSESPQALPAPAQLGQAIFVAHGKNKKSLEQLKRILDQFRIPYKVAVEEPNLGRPIGTKVKEVMQGCNCAILIFTADEEFKDNEGKTVWRPSENVVYELGAAGYVYGNRIVIMKEDGVDFPANFRDLGYISFSRDALEAKAMDVLKELIGFGIVKVST